MYILVILLLFHLLNGEIYFLDSYKCDRCRSVIGKRTYWKTSCDIYIYQATQDHLNSILNPIISVTFLLYKHMISCRTKALRDCVDRPQSYSSLQTKTDM